MWWVGERLLTGSVQGTFVVALVWLVCRNIAAIPASARAFLWWLASLKLALALVPLPSLPVPLLPAGPAAAFALGASTFALRATADKSAPREAGHYVDTTIASRAADALRSSRLSRALLDAPAALSRASADEGARSIEPARTVHEWLAVAIGLWLAGVAALTLHLLPVYARLRSAVRSSTPLGTEDADVVDRLARRLGLKTTPEVRVSDRVTTPLVAGVFRPTVLIPAEALVTLSPGERAMAICHELAHVRRRDLLLGWVPALAERLFFFHPLARLAAREYVVAREAACDTLVLRAMDVAPQEYGRMLVRLGVGGLDPAFMAAGSSPSISSLRRRLDMLHHLTFTGSRRRVIGLLVAVSVLTLVPLRIVARTPLQPEVPAAAAPVLVDVGAEQATSPLPAQESARTQPATPSVSAAVINFTGNQEPTEAARIVQKAKELAQQESANEQQRRRIEEMEKTMKAAAELRQKAEEARQDDAMARYLRLVEAARTSRDQAGTLNAQAGVARQLEALTVAQQTLIEQLKNLAVQQDKLSSMQRQLSDQVEIIRRELERATRALTATPAK